MDLVGLIIEAVNYVGGPIVTHLEDQIKFNDSLEEYKGRKDELSNRKHGIELKLNRELTYGKVAKQEVQRWLKDAETFITRPAVEVEVNSWGWFSWCCRVKILKERVQELEKIYESGDRYTDGCLVIDDLSASVVELPTEELQGSEAVKANILACLKGENVTMLGVWGMGGVGKTTIMKHVHNELLKEGKFKKIIWVTVSQNFDIRKLQEQIACSLKERLEEIQNETVRAGVLSKMLEEQKPYLLILDDVWSSFKLEDVGILKPDETNGCKLVLTTRSQEVARSMDCRRIKVETLSKDEALELFLKKVGDAVLSNHGGGIKKDLESTLKKIVAECNGLPLAIVTVASSLKGISEPPSWRAALNQLRDCRRNVAGTVDDVFKILKFSYDRLKNQQIQYCFLYCALFPEDYKISKEEIIENWIDEGFIDEEESRQSMKDEGYDILRKLQDNSLLEVIKDGRKGDCVRMHDLIRDMALNITRMSPRFLVEAGKALKELPESVNCAESVEKVSLMHNYIEEIPSSLAFSTCIRLTTLLLAHNKLSTISESVFEHMLELRILDLSFNLQLSSLPNSVSKLVKLTTLLLELTSLEKVPSLSGLESLKKLNLRGTKIKEVPEGLGMLKNLKCLFLCGSRGGHFLEIDEIADGVLSNLSKLQELIVDKSRIKLKGNVVGRLKKLEVFHGCFPTANEMRIFLKCQPNRLSDYFIKIVRKPSLVIHRFEEMQSPRYKKVVVFTGTSIVGENMLFPSIQILGIEECHDIRSLNDFSTINDATDLRECRIFNCKGMECIFPSWIHNPVVQTIEYLDLQLLHKLDGLFEADIIARSSPPPGTFSLLKVVWIFSCKKLKKLFPSWKLVEYLQNLEEIDPCTFLSLKKIKIQKCRRVKKLFPSGKLVEYLQNLEEIDVSDCEGMEEIIGSDPEEEGEGGDIIKKLILPKLKRLRLMHLPALKSICSRRAVMICDSLESISISDYKVRIPFHLPPYLSLYGLDNLDWLFEGELIAMSPPQPRPFSFLKIVMIKECKKLKKLFPSWKLVEYLQNLDRLDVTNCEEMEEIIASDPEGGGEEGGNIIKELILPKFKSLYLYNLPALKSICGRRAVMVSDSLENISITNCKALRRIPFCLPPRLSLKELDNLDWVFEVEFIAMSPPQPSTFSSLKNFVITGCNEIKKLFPSWKLVEYLQNLEEIDVRDCEGMEEIIGSDPEEEGEEGGDIIKKLILPKLKYLKLRLLPALKSICSKRAVMVCDFLEYITIEECKGLRRIPLSLPLVDNVQPSPPPSLKTIQLRRREEEWWESLEWDHPNAKDVLQPKVWFTS
ncbi:hypothetical protein SLEP1_g54681 [Rubroshorea leprosula]|uniref:AAA+ ATPase domain-containing protein n=1 Tax=Rubroshorea leprosula TaxID=152421 RepID=A0AAV5MFA4_9ROSI|nr:hypothetical protein SLEP1_g54681 [Rubroshorea leprosula]